MRPYERLETWKLAHELALAVYRVTDAFPKQERYGLVAQARRAALSVPCNIAEGCGKRGPRDFRRYLDVARGSLNELGYLLRFARDLGILSAESHQQLADLVNRTGFLSWRLYRSLDAPSAR